MQYIVEVENDGLQKEYIVNIEKENSQADSIKKEDDPYLIPVFPGAKVLLESGINEYEREKGRSDSLDNKAGVFIAAIVALITVYIQVIPFSSIVQAYVDATKAGVAILTVCLALLTVGLIIIATSFYYFYKAIKLRKYQRVNPVNLVDIKFLSYPEDQTAEAMVRHYKEIIEYNQNLNEAKADDITDGLKRCLIGFAIVSVATIMTCVVVGGI